VRLLAAPFAFLGARAGRAELLRDAAVALEGDWLADVGPRTELEGRYGPAEPLDALLLPALVNAHTHLELSHLAGKVPGGDGLPGWIGRFVRTRAEAPEDPGAVEVAVASLTRHGVAAVGDVTNTLAPLPALVRAGLAGTLFHEVYGLSAARIGAARAAAAEARRAHARLTPGLRIVPSPHAVYSTRPEVVAELLASGPSSIHLAEDPAERAFTASGSGPLAPLMAGLGSGEARPRGRSAVACAAPQLRPGNLAVHLVDLDGEDRAALRRSGATGVLCPRSNLHIGGRLPDLPGLFEAGIPLAVGTDSLASTPSLSPLAELAVLRRAFPEIPADRLLPLAWNGFAAGAPAVGWLQPGLAPGLLALPLEGARPADPAAWLLEAAAAEATFTWLAPHRPEAAA
jgi:cytosine/adenosine deaminase-related metal-dependent hydrolase